VSVEYGTPICPRQGPIPDLGLEEVGAGLLRRLIPGVIQATPNAGYYACYPYLLWKWEQQGGGIERDAFVPLYRRQEAAYALACALHEHRDGVACSAGARVRCGRSRSWPRGPRNAAPYLSREVGLKPLIMSPPR
jgi:hypothetical protein